MARNKAVNVKSAFFLTGTVALALAERGTGAAISLGFWVVRLGIPLASAYAASKGALEALTDYCVRGTVANRIGTPDQIAHTAVVGS